MSEDIEYVNRKVVETYRKLNRSKEFLIRNTDIKDKSEGLLYIYKHIRNELSKVESDESKIVNVLVKELFNNTKSPNKTTLWNCYGDILVSNIRQNLKDTKQCECCGVRIETYNTKKYCSLCADSILKEQVRLNMKKYRENKKRYKNQAL